MTSSGAARLVAFAAAALTPLALQAESYEISVDPIRIETAGFARTGIGYNGARTPAVLRFREGETVEIRVTNNLDEDTSIHWHGLILPFDQDGVPGISFPGIAPGETFTYRFPVRQSGTYWFHSHSGFQEPDGAYGAIVIAPEAAEPYAHDRDYVVQFADKHPHSGARVFRNLKLSADYYNRKQRDLGDLLSDIDEKGLGAALAERAAWGRMRMMPTDVEDVQGFAPLINGRGPEANWTGLFTPGERVRLRLINSSAMAYFDVRIPGLEMTVVAADGVDVAPVTVDELRLGVAETYDVIVRPMEDRAYSLLGESMGRTAMARGTLAPRAGMAGEVPPLRPAPRLTMADMGMSAGMDHGAMGRDGTPMAPGAAHDARPTGGADHAAMAPGHGSMPMGGPAEGSAQDTAQGAAQDMAHGGAHGAPRGGEDPFYAPGSGLAPQAAEGGKFLSYADLRARAPLYPDREATREIELRLTGVMERYIWSIDGVKYEDAEPIRLRYGERVRFKFVNETMMTHPMHLHGMWTILDVGAGARDPVKHTVSVAPGTTLYAETEVDAPGQWAFHCHLSYHMAGGMFRKVIVEGAPGQALNAPPPPSAPVPDGAHAAHGEG